MQDIHFKQDTTAIYTIIPLKDNFANKRLKAIVNKLKIPSYELVYCQFESNEIPFLGFIYLTTDCKNKQHFLKTVQAELDI